MLGSDPWKSIWTYVVLTDSFNLTFMTYGDVVKAPFPLVPEAWMYEIRPYSPQWTGWGQLGFGSYLRVKVKAVALSLGHLTVGGLLLKAHSWSQMLNGCQVQLVILNVWNYGRTTLQACSCSFSLHKTREVSQQQKPPPLSLVGSTHSLVSGTKRLELLSIFFEDELKQRLLMWNVL